MRDRRYYSQRTGKNPKAGRLDLGGVKRLFGSLYGQLDAEGYFQEYLGYDCVDAGFVPGKLGTDLEGELLLTLGKENLWPVRVAIEDFSEDDLFDVIEFLYDHVSKPVERSYHGWSECGWHCSTFDQPAGQNEYRDKVNRLLRSYDTGFELSASGEVLAVADDGLSPLLEAPPPPSDPDNVNARVEAAIVKFRRHRAPLAERKDAIRDLADVLEFLRPKMKELPLRDDEKDLFNIANNFGIRHHNDKQKVGYDQAIWYSWMFYYYLATIHAVTRMVAAASRAGSS